MRTNKWKPDYFLILAVLVGIGVVVTMKAQVDAQSAAVANEAESQALYHYAWTKVNAKVDQKIIRK